MWQWWFAFFFNHSREWVKTWHATCWACPKIMDRETGSTRFLKPSQVKLRRNILSASNFDNTLVHQIELNLLQDNISSEPFQFLHAKCLVLFWTLLLHTRIKLWSVLRFQKWHCTSRWNNSQVFYEIFIYKQNLKNRFWFAEWKAWTDLKRNRGNYRKQV